MTSDRTESVVYFQLEFNLDLSIIFFRLIAITVIAFL